MSTAPPLPIALVVEDALTPAESLARDVRLVASRGRLRDDFAGTLRVYQLRGDVVSIGRWHVAPAARGRVRCLRRHSGGRVCAFGDGFVGVTLALPHRSALVAWDEPDALAPAQVMNRCVRGILGALEEAGLPATYPGRETVTVGRRPIALMAFEVAPNGTLLFEAVVSVARDLSVLPRLLDDVDPAGAVRVAMASPSEVTSVRGETGRTPDLEELAGWLARGYRHRLGLAVTRAAPVGAADFEATAWLANRTLDPALDRHVTTPIPLGVLEAHLAVGTDGRLARVLLTGDLIAASGTVAALEQALRGCPPDRAAIADVIRAVLRQPGHFVLGIGSEETLTDTLVRGVGA